MRELSLFTGAGGGCLGSVLLGHTIVGAVEIEPEPCRSLYQRQLDGILDTFPVFNMDLREFNARIAPVYTGLVDLVSGGFPCQDISCAGKGAGIEGERSGLWSAMRETIRIVRPSYVLVENSPMLTIRGLGTVLGDLAALGFDAAWGVVSAANSGARHERKRIWIMGHACRQ